MAPLLDALRRDVMTSEVLHGDDTPVPVLAPGAGKTKTGRLWVYVRDERSYDGERSPAAAFFYSVDRAGERPRAHLKDFTGVLHADGYAGFKGLYQGNRIVEAACWAHVRRKFFDVHAANGSEIAKEALDRICALYGVEAAISGTRPEERRFQRQIQSRPIADAIKRWTEEVLPKLSARSELAKAFRYMLSRWLALTRCFDDGRLSLDNNPAERALRGVAVLESLCIPSSSVCKHWDRVVVSDATWATFSGHRRFDRLRRQVGGARAHPAPLAARRI